MHRLLLVGVVLLVSTACGGSEAAFCKAVNDCQGGNKADTRACTVSQKASEDRAKVYECVSEYREWRACIEDESSCEDGFYTPPVGTCDDVSTAYFDCQGVALGF